MSAAWPSVSSNEQPEYRMNLSLWADQSESSRRTFAGNGSADNDSNKRVTFSLGSAAQARSHFLPVKAKHGGGVFRDEIADGRQLPHHARGIQLGLHVQIKTRRHSQRRLGDRARQCSR